jgi:formyltetrahydrofolate deformylase
MHPENTVICISCPDQPGIIAGVTTIIKNNNGNLTSTEQFTETEINPPWFYMRLEIETETILETQEKLKGELIIYCQKIGGKIKFIAPEEKQNVAILVTKASHCLNELLWRYNAQELPMNLKGVISNSNRLEKEVNKYNIPFSKVDIHSEGFEQIANKCQEWGVQTIVMARFMQIAPAWFCKLYENNLINIHHSFLPAFIGAKPYHQAKERGVKIIGATCHYATTEIDSGPIIEQDVTRVEHYHTIKKMITLGQDCEKIALAKGLKLHLENRVFIHGNQTVVFRH